MFLDKGNVKKTQRNSSVVPHLCSPAAKGGHDGHVTSRSGVGQRRETALRGGVNGGAELKQQRHHVHVAHVGMYTQDGGVVQHLRTVVHISTTEHQQPAHLTPPRDEKNKQTQK